MTIIKSLKLLISKFPLFLVGEIISIAFSLIGAIIPIRIVKQISTNEYENEIISLDKNEYKERNKYFDDNYKEKSITLEESFKDSKEMLKPENNNKYNLK